MQNQPPYWGIVFANVIPGKTTNELELLAYRNSETYGLVKRPS